MARTYSEFCDVLADIVRTAEAMWHLGVDDPLSPIEPERLTTVSIPNVPITTRRYNAGARIADDCFCSGCGKRGVVGFCSVCSQ